VGDLLLPRSETGQFRHYRILEDLYSIGKGGWLARAGRPYPGHAERVYLCASRDTARGQYAAGYTAFLEALGAPGAGTLYRAEPDGEALEDPTVAYGWYCERAVITAVEEEAVPRAATAAGNMAVAMMRECYEEWKDLFNGGADRWPAPPAPAARSPRRGRKAATR
jgi:hypothetical protein